MTNQLAALCADILAGRPIQPGPLTRAAVAAGLVDYNLHHGWTLHHAGRVLASMVTVTHTIWIWDYNMGDFDRPPTDDEIENAISDLNDLTGEGATHDDVAITVWERDQRVIDALLDAALGTP